MQYNKDEKKCIRIIAKWFRENKRTVNRSEAIKEFGVDDDTYDVLIKIMEHNGVVEVESGMREGYASLIRPLAYAEELAREFDAEENETNQKNKTLEHTSLQNDFIEFLKKKKGYPRESILPANKGGAPDLSIIELGSKKPIVLIEFKLSNEQIVLGRAALDFIHYKKTRKLSNCLAYIVCPSLDKSSEPFEIYEMIDNGYESLVSMNDFPAYEEREPKIPDKKLTLSDFESKLDVDGIKIFNKVIDSAESSSPYTSVTS